MYESLKPTQAAMGGGVCDLWLKGTGKALEVLECNLGKVVRSLTNVYTLSWRHISDPLCLIVHCLPGVTMAGRVPSVTSASPTLAVCTARALSPGSVPVRRTGEVCCVTKVSNTPTPLCLIRPQFKSFIVNIWNSAQYHRQTNTR